MRCGGNYALEKKARAIIMNDELFSLRLVIMNDEL